MNRTIVTFVFFLMFSFANAQSGKTTPGATIAILNTNYTLVADANGHFEVRNAFGLPDVTGNNQLIFVGQQSQTEVTATFATAVPTPPTP